MTILNTAIGHGAVGFAVATLPGLTQLVKFADGNYSADSRIVLTAYLCTGLAVGIAMALRKATEKQRERGHRDRDID